MDFSTAISTCFSKYVDFTGRARRSEYWFFYLFHIIGIVIATVMDVMLDTTIVSNLFYLAMLLPSLSAAVRRLHDVGKSGWFILVPIYNLILLVTDTQPVPNKYGVPAK